MSFAWDWSLKEIKQDKPVKVFSCFSCGGGSSMGYKRAGFEVIGNVEIDPKMNQIYLKNNKPKYNFLEDLRQFNQRDDLPDELYGIDILDGSPPCTSFSTAGIREEGWGKTKKFREGQAAQTLDDLFFVFLDTVEKLRPRVVIAENVPGIATGKAKGYVNLIIKRFKQLGYDLQIFALNAAHMDVPQARHRIFFIANRCGFPKLDLRFKGEPIFFGKIKSDHGKPITSSMALTLLDAVRPGDRKLSYVTDRISGCKSYYGYQLVHDEQVCFTVTSTGVYIRVDDRETFSDEDFIRVQSFPRDYEFMGNSVQYVTGMSVPPNMMANVAMEVWEQWLR